MTNKAYYRIASVLERLIAREAKAQIPNNNYEPSEAQINYHRKLEEEAREAFRLFEEECGN